MPEQSADPLNKIYVEPTNRCNLIMPLSGSV
jgi:hypothetical protein